MKKSRKLAWVVLGVVVVSAAVVSLIVVWPSVEWWLYHEKVEETDANGIRTAYWRVRGWTGSPVRKYGPGPIVSYFPDGTVKMKGPYDYPLKIPDGVWTWWKPNGNLEKQERWEGRVLIEIRTSPPWLPDNDGSPVTDQVRTIR